MGNFRGFLGVEEASRILVVRKGPCGSIVFVASEASVGGESFFVYASVFFDVIAYAVHKYFYYAHANFSFYNMARIL